jgi:distribution and morphology protein 31
MIPQGLRLGTILRQMSTASNSSPQPDKGKISAYLRKLFVGHRRWTFDDFLALFSWIFVGNTLFILLRTTAFVSVILAVASLLPFEKNISALLSEYVTMATGLKTTVGSVSSNGQDGRIRLNDVTIEYRTVPLTNYSHFKIEVRTVDITIDLLRWFKGYGIVKECKMQGVRGVLDRRHLDFTGVDPETWLIKRQPLRGDLHLTNFEIEDCFINVLDMNDYRPYTILIHQAKMKRFRIQWLLYDLLDAENITGEYDGSLFSLTKPKFISGDYSMMPQYKKLPWSQKSLRDKQISLIRVSGMNIDLLNRGDPGPFGWITQGLADLDIVYMLPSLDPENGDNHLIEMDDPIDTKEPPIKRVFEEMEEVKEENIEGSDGSGETTEVSHISGQDQESSTNQQRGNEVVEPISPADDKDLRIPFFADLRLHHIRAALPPTLPSNTTVPTFLVRPIVAYFNAQPTSPRNRKSSTPPLTCLFTLNLSDFNGAWTVYQSRLINEFSNALGQALIDSVLSEYQSFIDKGKKGKSNISTRSIEKEADSNEKIVQEFENYYREKGMKGEAKSSDLIAKVGWFSLQQLSKQVLAYYGGQFGVPRDPEDEQFLSVFEEIVRRTE